jgi:hypothetical protein
MTTVGTSNTYFATLIGRADVHLGAYRNPNLAYPADNFYLRTFETAGRRFY